MGTTTTTREHWREKCFWATQQLPMIEVWWKIGPKNIAMFSEHFQCHCILKCGILIVKRSSFETSPVLLTTKSMMEMNCVVKIKVLAFSASEAKLVHIVHLCRRETLVQLIIRDKLKTISL